MPAPVNTSIGNPPEAWTTLQDKASGSFVMYIGKAKSHQQPYAVTVSAVSKAAAAAFTATAHGLASDNLITISGATEDWKALNGTHIITVTGADGFTIAVDSSEYSGDFDGTVTTTAPSTAKAIWSIHKVYDADATRTAYAGGSSDPNQVWGNRASLSYQ
jgi:hypothetical protein